MNGHSTRLSSVQRYSLRRVNPFLGLVAVVKTSTGRAMSVDGRLWQIQIPAHPPRGLWGGYGEQKEVLQYFRFGVWSAADGLGRVPLNPILAVGRMVSAAEGLVEAVRAAETGLPFALAPELEFWLLDQDQLPLALLATALEDVDLDQVAVAQWSAGGRGERHFVSRTLAAKGPRESDGNAARRHVEALERIVHEAAGRRLNRQWFRRDEQGGGEGLPHRLAEERLGGRRLPASAFPPLPLRTEWPDGEDRRLVADYVAWLAPYLLTLPGLDAALRRRLEAKAVQDDAVLVDSLWRLYPTVLDHEALNRARVEARLRRANS